MVRRITTYLIFGCLLVAIPLAIMGYHKVELGRPFLALLRQSSRDLENFKIGIPDIPPIPLFENPQGFELVLNFLVKLVNGLSTLINFIIKVLNVVIQLIQYIVILIRNAIGFKDSIQPVQS